MIALILAGGYGTRLGPIGKKIPKAMLMYDDDVALNHLIKRLNEVGLDYYILINRKFACWFKDYDNVLIEETKSDEQKPGAVSAIWQFIERKNIKEDVLILASDNYFGKNFGEMLKYYSGNPTIAVSYGGRIPEIDPKETGTLGFEGCNKCPPPKKYFEITEFKEKSPKPPSHYFATGAYIVPKSVFPVLKKFCKGYKRDDLGRMVVYFLEKGIRVDGYYYSGEWLDISHRSYLEELGKGKLVKMDRKSIVVGRDVGDLSISLIILRSGASISRKAESKASIIFLVEGKGIIEHNGSKKLIRSSDAAPIEPGKKYKVHNNSNKDLVLLITSGK